MEALQQQLIDKRGDVSRLVANVRDLTAEQQSLGGVRERLEQVSADRDRLAKRSTTLEHQLEEACTKKGFLVADCVNQHACIDELTTHLAEQRGDEPQRPLQYLTAGKEEATSLAFGGLRFFGMASVRQSKSSTLLGATWH